MPPCRTPEPGSRTAPVCRTAEPGSRTVTGVPNRAVGLLPVCHTVKLCAESARIPSAQQQERKNDMSFEKQKQKWIDFMDMSSDVKDMILINYNFKDEIGPGPLPYHENKEQRIAWHAECYKRQEEFSASLGDDRVPAVYPSTGTEIFAEAFGSKVHKSIDNMPFALPVIFDIADIGKLKEPDIMNSNLSEVFEIAERLRQLCGRDAIVRLPDIQSPWDISALVCEKTACMMAMYDDPDALKELTMMCERTVCRFLDAWFQEFGTDYVAHYPDYFMRGGVTLSEDDIGIINSDTFLEFCLDSLNRLSNRYGGIGIHCCANSAHQWENFLKIDGLRLLNLNQPMDVLKKAFVFFENRYAQMPGDGNEGLPEREWLAGNVKNAHLAFRYYADSREDAKEKLKMLRELEEIRK